MITMKTLERLYHCMREIEAGKKLLTDIETERNRPFRDHEKDAPVLQDAFGRRQHLQLGIPSGENAHRIFQVAPDLAESVIRAHIAKKQAELVEANEQARIELNT